MHTLTPESDATAESRATASTANILTHLSPPAEGARITRR
nr:MAG TPA: hypothetical protein [Caudoviricetes sp.]